MLEQCLRQSFPRFNSKSSMDKKACLARAKPMGGIQEIPDNIIFLNDRQLGAGEFHSLPYSTKKSAAAQLKWPATNCAGES